MAGRRLALALVVALAAVATASAPPARAAAERPNVVLVLTDDQRWDQLARMPNVQRELVSRGVTFTNSFVVNPLCCPSRATLLTGRYSHSTRVYGNTPPYGGASWFDDRSTLGTWLAAAGYRTGYVGKYLNGYWLNWVPPGWHRWFAVVGSYFGYSANVDGVIASFGTDEASYMTDVLAREAVSFVTSAPRPFFLLFAPYAPHGPATPAPRHAGTFADLTAPRPPNDDEADVSDKPAWVRALPPLGPGSDAREVRERRMLESLLAVDDAVGALVAALRETGSLRDTVLVFTSDNGLLLGEHRLVEKKVAAYEESIRVPLVVRYDALGTAPRHEPRLVANVDLAPTVAELAGTTAPGAEGLSLLPLLTSSPSPARWRSSFLVEGLGPRPRAGSPIPTYCAVRRARWKYVVYRTREEELYDLAADPFELENLASEPARRPLLFSLRAEVKRLCDPPPPGFGLGWLCTREGGDAPAALRGTAGPDRICGGRAAETIAGRRGDDVLVGGGGGDRLVGGPGRDVAKAGIGADVVLARDGQRDRLSCGPGRDTVWADRGDAVRTDCERVDRGRRSRYPSPSSSA